MLDVWIMAGTQFRRDWLSRNLNDDVSIHIAGTAPTFALLRSLIAEGFADVILLDLPSPQGSATIREWLTEFEELAPVLVLVPEHDRQIFNRILAAKAGGMLRTDAPPERIRRAVQCVASGLLAFDRDLVPSHSEENSLFEPLTPRETEVLRFLAEGLGNKEIGSRLNISEHTIKFHIRSILGKLGASTRTEAVSRGVRSGLIDL